MNKLGFTEKEVNHMRFGRWSDLFMAYKKVYNFETKKYLYDLGEERKITSLLDL